MRYKLLTVASFIAGYIVGVIFGYRAAVADYVENDARTIRSMADTMYEEIQSPEFDLQQMIEQADGEQIGDSDDDPESNGASKGFQ